jgi:hypothetical protein
MNYAALLKDFGPLVGIILFFIWRDWKREEGLVDRVRKLEDFNTNVLVGLVKEQASIIATNTSVIRANTEQQRTMATLMGACKVKQDG